jgi:hypothetical protein
MNIQSEAERRYPYNIEIMSERDLIMRAKKEAFIAGATWEQERSKVLVECLEKVGREIRIVLPNEVNIEDAAQMSMYHSYRAIQQALNTYNNE